MKILCDERAKKNVIDELGVAYDTVETVALKGYECVHFENEVFYISEVASEPEYSFLVIELSEQDVWQLDKFQCFTAVAKKRVAIEAMKLDEAESSDLLIYVRREDNSKIEIAPAIDVIKKYEEQKKQLNVCDLYLLVPGKLESEECVWENLPSMKSQVFDVFRQKIDYCVKTEYNSDFVKKLSRKCIGQVVLTMVDSNKREYYQSALVGVVKHETGLCVLEIIVQNCYVGGNKLLNYYCANEMEILFQGNRYSIREFCTFLKIRCFGKKRSLVFAYDDLSDEEMINALANEEFPMGTIGGDFLKKIREENIALYDTAEVYVSHETMLEKCRIMDVFGEQRLGYQAIELFFVELILLYDAAVDKIHVELNNEVERQRNRNDISGATLRYEQLSFDMAQAIRFGDYEQFNFPTVRESAKKVAKSFGLESIFEKYTRNKELLGSMIEANKRRLEEKQDSVKNMFLLLISALATVDGVAKLVDLIYQGNRGEIICYAIALTIVLGLYALCKLIIKRIGLSKKRKK